MNRNQHGPGQKPVKWRDGSAAAAGDKLAFWVSSSVLHEKCVLMWTGIYIHLGIRGDKLPDSFSSISPDSSKKQGSSAKVSLCKRAKCQIILFRKVFPQVNLINRASNTSEFYYIVNLFRGLFQLILKLSKKQGKPQKIKSNKWISFCSLSPGVCYLRALICGTSFLERLREIGLYSHDWADNNKWLRTVNVWMYLTEINQLRTLVNVKRCGAWNN